MEEECVEKINCDDPDPRKENPYKIIRGRPDHPAACVADCPGGYESKKVGGKWMCKECQECPKICDAVHVTSRASAEALNGCTHITGSLEIQVSRSTPSYSDLKRHLGRIKVIEGGLKVFQSMSLISLNFFTSLQEIQGKGECLGFSLDANRFCTC